MIHQRKNKAQREFLHIFNVDNLDPDASVAASPPDPNRTMCFHGTKTFKSDDEIVTGSDYKFNLPIDMLINNSENTRLARNNRVNGKQDVPRVPRRQNAWILYRRDKSLNLEFEGKKSSHISKEIAKMWNKESRETVELFEALARKAVDKHKEIYGINYKYEPGPQKKPSKDVSKDISKDAPNNNVSKYKPKKERRAVDRNKSSIMDAERQFFPDPFPSSELPSETITENPNLATTNSPSGSFSASIINTEQQLPIISNFHSPINPLSGSLPTSITNTEQQFPPTPITPNLNPIINTELPTSVTSNFVTEQQFPPIPATTNFHSPSEIEGSLPNHLPTPHESDALQFSTLDSTSSATSSCDFPDFPNSNNINDAAESESFNGINSEQSFITNIYFSYYTN